VPILSVGVSPCQGFTPSLPAGRPSRSCPGHRYAVVVAGRSALRPPPGSPGVSRGRTEAVGVRRPEERSGWTGAGSDAARAHERAASIEDADRLAPSPTFALAHPLDDVSVWPQPKQCQTPSSRCSRKEGERSKLPWEGSGQRTMTDPEVLQRLVSARRTTSPRLWSARAASMVAGCRGARDDTDVGRSRRVERSRIMA
jgi:hypothetical protein